MDDSSKKKLKRPAGEPECELPEEVGKLRSQINEMAELVSTDALTGLYNFRHFKNLLQAEMDRSKRSGIPTTLVVADLDHFKNINDTHGQEISDLVLRHVAGIIKNEVRTTDWVCRYGGEEFAMIFSQTHLNLAVKAADRIREKIATSPVIYDKGALDITASMGASVYIKASIIDIDTFVDSVDNYLFEAKQSGRNCICHIDYADLHKVAEVGVDPRVMLFDKDV